MQFFASKNIPKIVTLCGSQRNGSFNQMVHDYAVSSFENIIGGAEVTPVNIDELNLPLYDPNKEANEPFPEKAKYLKI